MKGNRMVNSEIEHAIELYEVGEYCEASEAFAVLFGKLPDNGDICVWAAYIELLNSGNIKKAKQWLRKGSRLVHRNSFYHRVLGEILWEQGHFKRAASKFKKAIQEECILRDQTIPVKTLSVLKDPLILRAWAHIVLNYPEDYSNLLSLATDYLCKKETRMAKDLLKEVKDSHSNNAKILNLLGIFFYESGDFNKASEYFLFSRAMGFQPTPSFLSKLACALGSSGDTVAAVKAAWEAQSIGASGSMLSDVVTYIVDLVIDRCGNIPVDENDEALTLALGYWPENSRLLVCMGKKKISFEKDIEAGKSYFAKAFDKGDVADDFLWVVKGVTWYDFLGEKNEGIRFLERAIAINPIPGNLLQLAHRLFEMNPERAKKLIYEAYRKNSDDFSILYQLADIEIRHGSIDKGMRGAQKAAKLEPESPFIHALLGTGFFKVGSYTKSLESYSRAMELGYEHKAYIYSAIAEIYLEIGDPARAHENAVQAIRFEPNNEEAQKVLENLNLAEQDSTS